MDSVLRQKRIPYYVNPFPPADYFGGFCKYKPVVLWVGLVINSNKQKNVLCLNSHYSPIPADDITKHLIFADELDDKASTFPQANWMIKHLFFANELDDKASNFLQTNRMTILIFCRRTR